MARLLAFVTMKDGLVVRSPGPRRCLLTSSFGCLRRDRALEALPRRDMDDRLRPRISEVKD